MVKTKILGMLLGGLSTLPTLAQTEVPKSYRDLPIIVTLQFHSLALPFQNLKSNFSNVGIGLGTEVGLNRQKTLLQQVNLIWYRNRAAGNGVMLYSQSAWRPTITGNFYTELKAGAGYMLSFRPSGSFKPVNGEWVPVGHKGKGMLAVPVGVSLGYNSPSGKVGFSPFASYQFMVISGYSQSIPIVPQSLIQIGSRINLEK